MARNPIKDQVAIVGVGSTGFRRDAGGRSSASLACEASIAAIRDAGLGADDIDGITVAAEPGSPNPPRLASMLGIQRVSHFASAQPVAGFGLVDAMNAVFSGSCEAVLLCFAVMRSPWNSRSAARDPFRRTVGAGVRPVPELVQGAAGYASWASRYIHEYGARREDFGYVAINSRTGAVGNPLAAIRTPIDMQDYLDARMIREPLSMLDMDLPVDGADAFVLTTAERARELRPDPVLIHAASVGLVDRNDEDQLLDLSRHGQHVVIEQLKAKSDLWLSDVDVYLPYDGFTIITLNWIENAGWCEPGGAGRFLESHWDAAGNRVLIDGRVPMNPHGGSLSEGATRASGHIREAVVQLRGTAGERQVPDASVALVTAGGFFFNSQGAIFRRG
ncbi:MAG: thiolase family protein [Proteobacteria bacterium]|nr:thiolase family protein [Pseudomonadota bacterium]